MLIDHGDAVGAQTGHGARDQVLDCADLFAGRLAPADADANRRRRLFGVFLKQLPLWQDQVNPGGGDPIERPDRARQLAFQSALAVQLLDKVRLPQGIGLVEDLVTDRSGGRQSLAGQHQSGGRHLVAVHQQGRAIALGFILHPRLIQRLGDRSGLFQVQVGVKQSLGLAQVHKYRRHYRCKARTDAQDRGQTTDPESTESRKQWIQDRTPLPEHRAACDLAASADLLGRIYPVLG